MPRSHAVCPGRPVSSALPWPAPASQQRLEKLEDEIKIVVIATNFDHESGFRIPTPPVDTEVPEDKITEVEPQTEQEPINDDLDISALIDMLNHDRDKRS